MSCIAATGAVGQSSEAGAQQDVSEFQHKLLEWLEDAFKHDKNSYPAASCAAAAEQKSTSSDS